MILLVRVLGDVFVVKNAADGVFKPVPDMGQLEKFGEGSHQNTRTYEQHQHGNTPDETVYGAVHISNHFYHKYISSSFSLLSVSKKA